MQSVIPVLKFAILKLCDLAMNDWGREPCDSEVTTFCCHLLVDAAAREARAAHDDGLAGTLRCSRRAAFVREWYSQPMWLSLRQHPRFSQLLARRSIGVPLRLPMPLSHSGNK